MAVSVGRPPFEVEVLRDGEVPVLAVHGDIDLATAPLLARALHEYRETSVVLDLCGCGFMDSTGLGLILDHSKTNPGRFALACRESSSPRRVFELTATVGLVPIHSSRADALASLSRSRT